MRIDIIFSFILECEDCCAFVRVLEFLFQFYSIHLQATTIFHADLRYNVFTVSKRSRVNQPYHSSLYDSKIHFVCDSMPNEMGFISFATFFLSHSQSRFRSPSFGLPIHQIADVGCRWVFFLSRTTNVNDCNWALPSLEHFSIWRRRRKNLQPLNDKFYLELVK